MTSAVVARHRLALRAVAVEAEYGLLVVPLLAAADDGKIVAEIGLDRVLDVVGGFAGRPLRLLPDRVAECVVPLTLVADAGRA